MSRANLFYRVTVPEEEMKPTDEIFEQKWYGLDDFLTLYISPGTGNVVEELRKVLQNT